VRPLAGEPGALSWASTLVEALEAAPAIAVAARGAARAAAARAGLVLTGEPVIVTWQADAAGHLAAQRPRLGGVALSALLAWALLVAAEAARHCRLPRA
jgi:hypothetical protein